MLVPTHLGFDDVEDLAQATSTKPPTYEELENRYRTAKPLDDGTPEQILNGLLNNQKEIRTSIQAYPQDAPKFRTFLFTNSRIAAHIYSSLTPDSKKTLRALVKEITDHTPDLRESLKKEHFRFDDKVRHFTLPKNTFNHGLHLGQQKKAMGFTAEEEAARQNIVDQLKDRAKMEGRVLTQDEIREILDARKPVPARHIQKLKEPPKATPAVPTPGTPGAVKAVPGKPLKGFNGLGWLGQVSQADAFTANAENAFRTGDVNTRVDILDKVADVRSALDAVEAGTLAPDKVLEASSGESQFPVIPVVIVGAGVLGLLAYLFLKK